MSSPIPNVVSKGACPGRTPKYPWLPGMTISSAVSATTSRVGVAISSVRRSATLGARGELLRLVHRLADVADHVERLLGQLVVLTVDDFPEALDGIRELHVPPLRTGERLGDEHGLGEKPLDLPRAGDDELVLVGELLHSEDRDDVLEVLVALEDELHVAGCPVVVRAGDVRIEDPRGGGERVHGRIDPELRERAREHGGRVEVREGGGGRRVGDVVGRHVDRLHRGDRALLRGGDALLELAHFGAQRRLIADRRRHAAEQRRDFGPGLREPEDVVDEQQHVFPFLVTEVLRGGEAGEADAQSCAGRLGHLTEDERGLLEDARLLHLVIEVVALPGTLADARKDRDAAVLLCNVVDELLDQDRLPDPGSAEQARLAALRVRIQEVDDLDPRLEHLDLRRLVLEWGRRAMDRVRLLRLDRGALVHRFADHVEDPAERLRPDRDRDGRAGVVHGHPAPETVGRGHGDRPHLALAQVLRHLEGELLRIRKDVLVLDALDEERVVDARQLARLELHVDDRPDDLHDLPRAHASAPCLRGSAPPTMSSSSLVIFSWRALLYWIVRTSIISFAFFVAASIAVMRAPYSPASDSKRARNTWVRTCRGSSSSRIAFGFGS